MDTFGGYQLDLLLFRGRATRVYRGVRTEDEHPVVLKMLADSMPSGEQVARLRREYDVNRSIREPGITRTLEVCNVQTRWAIVFEDIGGQSLDRLVEHHRPAPRDALDIAITIAEGLGAIHRNRVIHKDITPANIVFCPETGEVEIIDFGISTALSREQPFLATPDLLEGTLAYMAPEQTGRMNRLVDYRSDYYALGTTLYFLFTGARPFSASDPLELIHCHIARPPVPPHELAPDLDINLSRLILKLMAKSAEDRYQSAHGIVSDLQAIASDWSSGIPFELGSRDHSTRFAIPEKLYGRDDEVATMVAAFERAAAGQAEVIAIRGRAGIGKSALINELNKPLVRRRGFFAAGKADQFKRDIPYAPIIGALRDLLRMLLAADEQVLTSWRERIRPELGADDELLAPLLPELDVLLGKGRLSRPDDPAAISDRHGDPVIEELSPAEAQRRFHHAFEQLVRVFTSSTQPLVLFIDDVQWVDTASLRLIELLAGDPGQSLLAVLAYRDNEVDETHPMHHTLARLRKWGVGLTEVDLGPLDEPAIRALLADTLGAEPDAEGVGEQGASPEARQARDDSLDALAAVCGDKTGGNPFFLIEFLELQHSEERFVCHPSSGYWSWDVAEIARIPVSENVVDLVLDRLATLPPESANALTYAACLGSGFALGPLAESLEQPADVVGEALWRALEAGLIMPLSADYRLIGTTSDFVPDVTYRFVHDRIQDAAYRRADLAERQVIHLRIGRHLEKRYLAGRDDESGDGLLFEVVTHLNAARDLISDPGESARLAEHDLQAGIRAISTASYEPALRFLDAGCALVAGAGWRERYDLTLQLHDRYMTAAHLAGEVAAMETAFATIVDAARTPIDTVHAYSTLIQSLTERHLLEEAVTRGLEILGRLDVRFPRKIRTYHLVASFLHTKLSLSRVPLEDIPHRPEMSAPREIARMQIMTAMGNATYYSEPELLALIVFRQIRIALEHGRSANSAIAFANYAAVLAGAMNDPAGAYDMVQMSMVMVDTHQYKAAMARVYFIAYGVIGPWKDPIIDHGSKIEDTFHASMMSGDLEYASQIAVSRVYVLELATPHVGELLEEMRPYRRSLQKLGQLSTLHWMDIHCQLLANLVAADGDGGDPGELCGSYLGHSEEESLAGFREAGDNTALISFLSVKTIACAFAGHYAEAIAADRMGHEFRVGGAAVAPIYPFYIIMACLAHLGDVAPGSRSEARAAMRAARKDIRFVRKTAALSRRNYGFGESMIDAEIARIRGRAGPAQALYRKAIDEARDGGLLAFEALCTERLGRHLAANGEHELGTYCLSQARSLFAAWGAGSKVAQIDREFPETARVLSAAPPAAGSLIATTTSRRSRDVLDFESVFRASQAISGQMEFSALMNEFLQVTLATAGAERGFLLLAEGDGLVCRVRGTARTAMTAASSTSEPTSEPLDAAGHPEGDPGSGNATIDVTVETTPLGDLEHELAASVIRYVANHQEAVILDDAAERGDFTDNEYIKQHRSRSLLCVPAMLRAELVAVLYLENNLVSGAFTDDRVRSLSMLASQGAVSIKNVHYVAEVERRTRLENEMAAAQAVQRALMPDSPKIPDVDLLTHYQAAAETGGDWYNYFHDPESSRLYIQIGDVTGHGLPSALVTGAACGAILGAYDLMQPIREISPEDSLHRLVAAASRAVADTGGRTGLYMTMLLLCIDTRTGDGVYTNAGHVAPLLFSGSRVTPLSRPGSPLGLAEPEHAIGRFSMAPGSRLFLFTDGLLGNAAPGQRPLRARRIGRLLQNSATLDDFQQDLLGEIASALDGTEPEDDCTFLVLARHPAPSPV